jgi:hypothetical protein
LAALSPARQGQDLAGATADTGGRDVANGGEEWYLGFGCRGT